MNAVSTRSRRVLALLLVCLAPAPAAGQQVPIFAGNEEMIWAGLGDPSAFRLLTKRPGRNWQQLTKARGTVLAAAAVGPQLHVVYEPRDTLIYDGSGSTLTSVNPRLSQWPDTTTRVALAGAFGADAGHQILSRQGEPIAVLAVVARPARAQSDQPEDDNQILTPEVVRTVTLGLMGFTGRKWVFLTDLATVDVVARSELHLAVRNRMIYVVLVADPDGANQLFRAVPPMGPPGQPDPTDPAGNPDPPEPDDQPDAPAPRPEPEPDPNAYRIERVELTGPAADQPILAAVAMEEALVLPVALPAETADDQPDRADDPLPGEQADEGAETAGVEAEDDPGATDETQPDPPDLAEEEIVEAKPEPGPSAWTCRLAQIDPLGQIEYVDVAVDGQPVRFASRPQAARMADRVGLLWREGDDWRFGHCSISGKFLSEQTPEAFRQTETSDLPAKLQEWVLWGIVIVTLTVILLRPRKPVQPFVLPEGMRTGSLLGRLVAYVLDQMPWAILAVVVFQPSPEALEDWTGAMQAKYPRLIYASLLGIGLYILYSTLLEHRYQTTMGKRLMKLRVVGNGGGKPTLQACFLRNLLKVVELSIPFSFFPVMLIVPFVTRFRQRVGDMLAFTTVIDARTAGAGTVETGPADVHDLPGAGPAIEKRPPDPDEQGQTDPDPDPEPRDSDPDADDRAES